MRKYLVAAICILLCVAGFNASAQDASSAFNLTYIPPSPSSAALGKFGEYPVNLGSGIPSISVPLFNYKGINNGLSLGLSLEYHAGGIRVEEVAGNVGTGWALNAGGVISRSMRSLPDDMPTYGYLANYPLPFPAWTPGGTNAVINGYLKNSLDGEQDVFNFNFNGHVGKFILDGTGNPLLITKEALKITPVHSAGLQFRGFIITDETGIKYTFLDQEITTVHASSVLGTVSYASSYYLTTIVNPTTRDTVKFTYNSSSSSVYNFGSESATNEQTGGAGIVYTTVFASPVATTSFLGQKKIKSIKLPDNTEFDFLYQPLSRCDLKGDSTLAEVQQRNSVTNQYKSFKLYQSYTDQFGLKYPYSPAPCDLSDPTNSISMRLRLDSVKETSTSASINPYRFTYNDTYSLPVTSSFNQDFWGFYNGTINSSGHLVPQLLTATNQVLQGADRRCDSNAVKAGVLTKITFPTGGYSQFDYEPNKAGDGHLVINYQKTNSVLLTNDSTFRTFVINDSPANQLVAYNFRMGIWCPSVSHSCSYIFKIKSADGATTYATQIFAYADLGTTKTSMITLPNGTYHLTWEYSTPLSCSCTDEFSFALSYNHSVPDTSQIGGGIRVKTITNYDGISHSNDIVKQYKYVNANGTSSGHAAMLPAFTHQYGNCFSSGGFVVYHNYLVRTAATSAPLTLSTGGINYARVEVKTLGPVNNGKEVDFFTSYQDFLPTSNDGNAFAFPFTPLQALEKNIGLQLQQEIYDGGNHLLKKTINSYQFPSSATDTATNYKVAIQYENTCASFSPTTYYIRGYNWIIYRNEKIQATTVDYTTSGDSLVTNHWYSYNPSYYTLSTDQTVNSKGDTLKNYHYYPFDYSISGSVLSAMADSNMIAKPVSNEYWRNVNHNWYVTGADAINYAAFNSTTQYLASQYYTMSSATPVPAATMGAFNPSVLLRVPALYELALTFNAYDAKANPLQLTQRTGPPTTYLWSYNKEMPIAQITNATYSTVETALGGSTVVNNFSNRSMPNKSDIDTYLAPLFTASSMANAETKSYVYDTVLGMISNTDQKGMPSYYEYDALFRLMNMKDEYGNIVKSTAYHYFGQPGGTGHSPTSGRVTSALNSANTLGSYFNYNNGQIRLTNGFTSVPTTGQSFHAYITSTDCIPIGLNLSNSQNYVLTSVPRIAGLTDTSKLNGRLTCQLMQTVQYIDGLGRPLQTVQVEGTANGMDFVQPFAYDVYGRESMKYLPYAANTYNGSYKPTALTTALDSFYTTPPPGVTSIPTPYAQSVYENSPLNRVLQQGAPGNPWQPYSSLISGSGHTVKTGYGVNVASEVPLWLTNGSGAAWGSTYYPAGTLYKDTTTDENGHMTFTYTDMQQHVVCKKVQSDAGYLSTNYIYDNLDNLTYVVPPIPSGTTYPTSFVESDPVFNNFIYGYHYDARRRMSRKKIPGKGWQYMVYNVNDQLVASQDSVQKNNTQWIFTKYDGQNRVVETGIWNNGGTGISQPSLQTSVNTFTTNWETAQNSGNGYTNSSWPTSNVTTTLTLNYYDGYSLIPGLPSGFTASGSSTMTVGLPTANLTNVLNTSDMLWGVNYYDDKGRVTTNYKQHYLGGVANVNNYDKTTFAYNFTNQDSTTTRQHYVNSSGTPSLTVTIVNNYTYDHVGRKTQTFEQINGGTNVLLSQTIYNEAGQAMTKQLNSTNSGASFSQNVAYTYNERGWLKSSAAPLFTMSLNYNDGTIPQYNGNIANQSWSSANSSGNYTYRYDAMNRLLSGKAGTGNTEKSIVYDNMGNITGLQRYLAGTEIDALNYSYTGNQLVAIIDSTSNNAGIKSEGPYSYAYDGNGNMVTDNSKGLGITYNILNLPNVNTLSGGTVSYVYDATGNKLRRTSTVGITTTTDYVSGIQYTNGAIAFIQTEDGRALNTSGTYAYQYNLTDNLGNARLSFNNTGATIQQDDYLPFGYDITIGTPTIPKNQYLYSGKELQTDLGLYDYGARLYDPVTAKWTSIDPLAEKDRKWSPYSYAHNNPIRFIDVDGMFVKPGDLFTSADAAATDFGKFYNGRSIMEGREYASAIYTVEKDGKTYYTYTEAAPGSKAGSTAPIVNNTVDDAHTHGNYTGNEPDPSNRYDDDHFSPKDIQNYKDDKQAGYVATPDGSLQKFDPKTNKTSVISTDLPSDPAEGSNRKNDISPYTGTSEKKDQQSMMKTTPAKQDAIPAIKTPPPSSIKTDSQQQ